MEYAGRRPLVIGAVVAVVAAAGLAAFALGREADGRNIVAVANPQMLETDGARVVVEVLNGTGRSGLARAGAALLRRRRIDVVYFGNGDPTDSTLILVRRGDAHVGARVARALGVGVVRTAVDTLLRVDVTVILGLDFIPPAGLRP